MELSDEELRALMREGQAAQEAIQRSKAEILEAIRSMPPSGEIVLGDKIGGDKIDGDKVSLTTVTAAEDAGRRPKLSAARRRRVATRASILTEEIELRQQRYQRLRRALAIEADELRKFQLEQQVQAEEQELDALEVQLRELERQLE